MKDGYVSGIVIGAAVVVAMFVLVFMVLTIHPVAGQDVEVTVEVEPTPEPTPEVTPEPDVTATPIPTDPHVTVCRSTDVEWVRFIFSGIPSTNWAYVAEGASLIGSALHADALSDGTALVQLWTDDGDWTEVQGNAGTPECGSPEANRTELLHYTAWDVTCDPCAWYFADDYGTVYHVADTPLQYEDGRSLTRLDAVEAHDYYVR